MVLCDREINEGEPNDAAFELLVQGTDPCSKHESVTNAFKFVIFLSNYVYSLRINMLHAAKGYVLELCAFICIKWFR